MTRVVQTPEERKRRRVERVRKRYLIRKLDPEFIRTRKAYQEKMKADPVYREKMRLRSRNAPRYTGYIDPAKTRQAMRKYRASEHGKIATREYKRRVSQTPEARMHARMRTRIIWAFRSLEMKKGSRTLEMVGCSCEALKERIEEQFLPGMTFDNRELWRIDHKIPMSIARNEEELKLLCHYSNLQPLWAAENIRKHARHDYPSVDAAIEAARQAKNLACQRFPRVEYRF